MGAILVYKPHSPYEPICFIASIERALRGPRKGQPSYKDALHLEKLKPWIPTRNLQLVHSSPRPGVVS